MGGEKKGSEVKMTFTSRDVWKTEVKGEKGLEKSGWGPVLAILLPVSSESSYCLKRKITGERRKRGI